MKNFLLVFLSIVALGELVTLGVINYQKPQKSVLAAAEESNITETSPTSTPLTTPKFDGPDFLALLPPSPSPSATQVESITLPATTPLKTRTPSPTPNKTITPTPTLKTSATPLPTTSPTPSPVITPTISPSPKPSITPAPTTTVIARVTYSSQEINSYIDRFAGQYAVDPNVVRHIALCESGFRANAVYLSYGGLFQFSASTWQTWRRKMGEDINPELRFNAEEAVQTACYVISKNGTSMWPNCKP